MKMVKCLPEFKYFYCTLEKKKISSKIRRSKVTDYAALTLVMIWNSIVIKHLFNSTCRAKYDK